MGRQNNACATRPYTSICCAIGFHSQSCSGIVRVLLTLQTLFFKLKCYAACLKYRSTLTMPRTKTNGAPSQVPTARKQTAINSYGRIRKTALLNGKNVTSQEAKVLDVSKSQSISEYTPPASRTVKRKRDKHDDHPDERKEPPRKISKTSDQRSKVRATGPSTPRKSRFNLQDLPTPSKQKCEKDEADYALRDKTVGALDVSEPTPSHLTTPSKLCHSNPQDLLTPEPTPTKPRSPRASLVTPTKGQQRLTDLKSLVAQAQGATESQPTQTENVHGASKSQLLKSRTTSLYSRLQAKSAARANAPPPPSPEELARRAALQRLPDVVRVLALPPARETKSRWSNPLPGLIQKIQQSARSPMGSSEIDRCLRLLVAEAEELDAVGFVSFLKRGEMEAVIVDVKFRPMEVERRVGEMLAKPP